MLVRLFFYFIVSLWSCPTLLAQNNEAGYLIQSGDSFYQLGYLGAALNQYSLALEQASLENDSALMAESHTNIAVILSKSDKKFESIEHGLKALEINLNLRDTAALSKNYSVLGAFYFRLQEYEKALTFYKKGLDISLKYKDSIGIANKYGMLGGIFMYQKQFDEADSCFQVQLEIVQKLGDLSEIAGAHNHLGVLDEELDQHAQAEQHYRISKLNYEKSLDLLGLAGAHGNIGVSLYKQGNIEEAIKETAKELAIRKSINDTVGSVQSHRKLAKFYSDIQDFPKAYNHLSQYDNLNRGIAEANNKKALEFMESRYKLHEREQEMKLLTQEIQLHELSIANQRFTLILLIGCIFLLLLIGGFGWSILRSRGREKQQKLRQRLIRSRMKPHFVFNTFNSIQSYFITQQYEDGKVYLRKFSSLIRIFLMRMDQEWTTLEEELQSILLFLEVEQFRLGKKLKYQIDINPTIDCNIIPFPSTLTQVYLENATEHGISELASDGEVTVRVFRKDHKFIHLEITDNGPGFHSGQIQKEDHTSLGLKLTNLRLQHLNRNKTDKFSVDIQNLAPEKENKGTKISIRIPHEE